MRQSIALSIILLLSLAAHSNAAIIPVTGTTITGPSNGAPALVTDGFVPAEGANWQVNTVWWSGLATQITINFGQLYNVQDVLVSVDNNDSYLVQYSTNGTTFINLFSIASGQGENTGGMDTYNTLNSDPEFWPGVDFFPVNAQYLRIFSQGGDNAYSVGEIQASGNLVGGAVPEPATLAIWGGLGVAGLIAARRRKKVLS